MNRRTFLRLAGLSSVVITFPNLMAAATQKRKPNIIFILIDDMGWKDAGFMGSHYYETPNMDRLAKEGMVFTNAYSTAPNCAPSRASILTGQYPPRTGIYTVGNSARGKAFRRKLIPIPNKTILDPAKITIAEALKSAGYVSASIGKWHLGDDPQYGPIAQGFDVNIGGNHMGHPKSYFSPYHNPNLPDGPKGEYLTDRLTNEAIKFIRQNKDRPFFLYLPHYAVHTPLQAKEKLIQKYKNKHGSHGQNNPVYAAMIESVDQGIGLILKTLKDLKLERNTVVILSSDNGGVKGITSQEPLRGGKGMLYEGGIRVPLVIRWPGIVKPNSRCDVPVIGVDFFPTIMEIAGIRKPVNQPIDGLSIVPLLRGGETLHRDALFWHFPAYLQAYKRRGNEGARDPYFRTRPVGVIRMGNWKLLQYFEDGELELYNLNNDIGEKRNVAPLYPEIRNRLYKRMKQWRKEIKAPIPTKLNPYYQKITL